MSQYFIYILPAFIASFFSYLIVLAFTRNDRKKKHLEFLEKQGVSALQLKLNALERLTIFMERIHPLSLATSLYQNGMTVLDLQLACINQARKEYDHNIAQQIYVSPKLWDKVRNAREENIILISETAAQLNAQDTAKSLLRALAEAIDKKDDHIASQEILFDFNKESQEILSLK